MYFNLCLVSMKLSLCENICNTCIHCFFRPNFVHPKQWDKFRAVDRKELECSSTCPLVCLVDNNDEMWVLIWELTGPCSRSFLPVVQGPIIPHSEYPTLPPGNRHIMALEDVLEAGFNRMFDEELDDCARGEKMQVKAGAEG